MASRRQRLNAEAQAIGFRNYHQWQQLRNNELYRSIVDRQHEVLPSWAQTKAGRPLKNPASRGVGRSFNGPLSRGIGQRIADARTRGLSEKDAIREALRDTARLLSVPLPPDGEYDWEAHREFYGQTP